MKGYTSMIDGHIDEADGYEEESVPYALDVEVLQLKEREEMTPTEAWRIKSANLMELYKLKKTDTFKGYTDADIEAELICFKAVNRMQKGARGE
jgi:hypothetical protein